MRDAGLTLNGEVWTDAFDAAVENIVAQVMIDNPAYDKNAVVSEVQDSLNGGNMSHEDR